MRNLMMGAALAALTTTPAMSGDWIIAVPDMLPGGGSALRAEVWDFFLETVGPGSSLRVLNATNPGQIAQITVPDEDKYARAKWRARSFARENRRIAEHLTSVEEGTSRSDVLRLLRHVAQTELKSEHARHVLLIGDMRQEFAHAPDASMTGAENLRLPSPDQLVSSLRSTPYGLGGEGFDGLERVFVHVCDVSDGLREDEMAALQHFFARYVGLRDGTLVTWTDDVPSCMTRFAAEIEDPLNTVSYGAGAPSMTMIEIGREVVETEPTTLIVNGIEVQQFNLFASAPHPTLAGVEVTTGVVYQPGNYPEVYEHAYCYFSVWHNGANLRFDIGRKDFNATIDWHDASSRSLSAGGVRQSDFSAARSACQWPET